MSFKLYSDQYGDRPIIPCDVCGQPIFDFWNDLATATPTDGQTVNVTVYHKNCVPPNPGSVVMLMIDFLRLLAMKSSIGDISTDETKDKMLVQIPSGSGFEAISHDGGV